MMLRFILLCSLIMIFANSAFPLPMTWTVVGLKFDDGGTASGFFDFDADAGLLATQG
jgi:hypothetical protein